MTNLSIAIYSANFGNYRKETSKGIDGIHHDANIDYYFFTDDTSITSNYWNIIITELNPQLSFINSHRHTAKYVKFVVPEILHKYDIIVWVDSKNIHNIQFSSNTINQLLQNKMDNIFFIKHPARSSIQQELMFTIENNVEDKNNGIKFFNKIKNIMFKSHLPDTTCMVYSNNMSNILLLKSVYDLLIANGLRRDQNIIQYVWQENNYENNISYFKFEDLDHIQYYNTNIQIHKNVIQDIFANITPTTKMLVFGLGYDSKMWYEGNNKNTYFVENKDEYINLNKNDIPLNNIIKYNYQTTCKSCFKLTREQLNKFTIPEKISNLAPFDIIIVDGPEGYSGDKPGRLIPCYWATLLSKPGTLIYVDDSSRKVENTCIKTFFNNKIVQKFPERLQCTKICM